MSGVIGTARGSAPHDHLCLVYDDSGQCQSRVLEFLAEGLARGWQVCHAANRDTTAWWDDLRDLDETVRSGRPGAVQVEPVGLVQAYAAATQDALAAGSALCADNRVELGEEPIAQVACLHPTANAGPARITEILEFSDMRVEPSA